jgi:inorganic pyrophosphatase
MKGRQDKQESKASNALADPSHLPSFEDNEEFEQEGNNVIRVIIETAKGSRNKFSYDEELHVFRLKKVLPEGMSFPCDFGFVPSTLADDGDPLDVLVLMDEAGCTGALVDCRVIGAILGEQTSKKEPKPVRNDRLLAVAIPSHTHSDLQDIGQLNDHQLRELEAFFVNYHRQYEEKFKLLGRCGAKDALKMVKQSIKRQAAAGRCILPFASKCGDFT